MNTAPQTPLDEAVKRLCEAIADLKHELQLMTISRNTAIDLYAKATNTLLKSQEREQTLVARAKELEANEVALETAIILLPSFDPEGPGTCTDRLVAAVNAAVSHPPA